MAGPPAWNHEWAQRFRDAGVGEDIIAQMHLTAGLALDEAGLQTALDEQRAAVQAAVDEGLAGNRYADEIKRILDPAGQLQAVRHAQLNPELSDQEVLRWAAEQDLQSRMGGVPGRAGVPMGMSPEMFTGMLPYMVVPGYGLAVWARGHDPATGEHIYKDPGILGMQGKVHALLAFNGAVQLGLMGNYAVKQHAASRLLAQAQAVPAAQRTATQRYLVDIAKARGLDQVTGMRRLLRYVPHTEANKALGGLRHAAHMAADLESGAVKGIHAANLRRTLSLAAEGRLRINSHTFYMPGSLSGLNHHQGGMLIGRGGARASASIGRHGVVELTISSGVSRRLSSAYALAGGQALHGVEAGSHVLDNFPVFDSQAVRRARASATMDGLAMRQMRVIGDVVDQMGMADDFASGARGKLYRILHVVRPTAGSEAAEAVRSLALERAGKAAVPGTTYRIGGLLNALHGVRESMRAKLTASVGAQNAARMGRIGKFAIPAAIAAAVAGGMMLMMRRGGGEAASPDAAVDALYREYLLEAEGPDAVAAHVEAREQGAPLVLSPEAAEVLGPHLEAAGIDVNRYVGAGR